MTDPSPCLLCLAAPCRPTCPAGASDLIARQIRYVPPDLLDEARAFHFPDLMRPRRSRWRRGLALLRVVGVSLAVVVALVVVIGGVLYAIGVGR